MNTFYHWTQCRRRIQQESFFYNTFQSTDLTRSSILICNPKIPLSLWGGTLHYIQDSLFVFKTQNNTSSNWCYCCANLEPTKCFLTDTAWWKSSIYFRHVSDFCSAQPLFHLSNHGEIWICFKVLLKEQIKHEAAFCHVWYLSVFWLQWQWNHPRDIYFWSWQEVDHFWRKNMNDSL